MGCACGGALVAKGAAMPEGWEALKRGGTTAALPQRAAAAAAIVAAMLCVDVCALCACVVCAWGGGARPRVVGSNRSSRPKL